MTDENYDDMIESMRNDGCDAWDDVQDVRWELQSIRGEDWRPEPELKPVAEDLLRIIFDETATTEEVQMAATTLVDVVAPDLLWDALQHRTPSVEVLKELANSPPTKG